LSGYQLDAISHCSIPHRQYAPISLYTDRGLDSFVAPEQPAALAEIVSLEGLNLATLFDMKLPDSGIVNETRESSISVNPDIEDEISRISLTRVGVTILAPLNGSPIQRLH
jgi:hypothetical protein